VAQLLYIEDETDIGEWVTKDLTERGHNVFPGRVSGLLAQGVL